ncbi:MAG TPA: nitronate monooxygenase [Cytophagales bacterium]|nr:nitronate monooxygenase [Cytophagales bacterium]
MKSVTSLFNIQYPIIQAGMVWCSGWKLAHAVSEAGGLGIIGAGSMSPDLLKEHIAKYQSNTHKPFAVNLPLLYKEVDQQIENIIAHQVPIVFTSAGSPVKYTRMLKDHNIVVVHVVSSVKFALKAQDAGVDAVVAEGFEAGGHNGREETTTLCLVPAVVDAVSIPVIAAGGISCGRSMFAAMALGAKGVQIGSRFAASAESSAHDLFKQQVLKAKEGDTELVLKQLNPVRIVKNGLYQQLKEAEVQCAPVEVIKEILGKGRSRKGIFEGDIQDGELEIGQVAMRIDAILPAATILSQIWSEYHHLKNNSSTIFP